MSELRILSASELDRSAHAQPFCCAVHLSSLVGWWDPERQLVVFRCPACSLAEWDRVAVRVAG